MDSHAKLLVLEGDQVITLWLDEAFEAQYNLLFGHCPFKTVFQSFDFLTAWYTTKSSEFFPVAVLQFEQDRLIGALWLAIRKNNLGKHKVKNAKIVCAGEYDAEYQTWLVEEDKEQIFLPKAFETIFKKFPKSKIIFRFLPNSESLKWLEADLYWQRFCVVQAFRRPLLQMNHPDYPGVYKKRHLKAKFNRFSKSGTMELVEVKALTDFVDVYEEVMLLLDFRQGALFNKTPSQDNPTRKSLFIKLFEKELLHVSVLKLNGQITSCIIGMKDGTWMHLSGLITYSPFFGKQSPGMVHIYVLGKLLEQEGFQYFDLTPGDDEYKERMASNADEVYELTVTQDSRFKLKRRLRKYFHELLLARGIRPMSFNLALQRKKYDLGFKLKNIKKSLLRSNTSSTKAGQPISLSEEMPELEKNNLAHLLLFKETKGVSRWTFLEDALARIYDGQNFMSAIYEDQLIYCQWISESYDNPYTTFCYVHPEWENRLSFKSQFSKSDV
jgi:hypothetical protein